MKISKSTRVGFRAVCLMVTLLMLLRGTVIYKADESVSIVDTKAFHATKDDIYPVYTLCLENFRNDPHHTSPLYSYSSDKNKDFKMNKEEINEYINAMMGTKYPEMSTKHRRYFVKNGEKTLNYDYDNITVDVTDYLAKVIMGSGDHVLYEWEEGDSEKPQPFFISYRHPQIKCFSLDLSELIRDNTEDSKTAISHLSITFNNTDTSLRLFQPGSEMLWKHFLHYPKQLMRSTALDWEHLGMHSERFSKVIYVDNVEVIRRRNTHNTPCDENYKQEDDLIIKRLAEQEGCSAPYWMLNAVDSKKPCTYGSDMSKLLTPDLRSIDPKFLSQFANEKPCSQVYGISYSVKNQAHPPSCRDHKPNSKANLDHHPSDDNSQHQQEDGNNPQENNNTGLLTNSQNLDDDNEFFQSKPLKPGGKAPSPQLKPGGKAPHLQLKPEGKAPHPQLKPGGKAPHPQLKPGGKAPHPQLDSKNQDIAIGHSQPKPSRPGGQSSHHQTNSRNPAKLPLKKKGSSEKDKSGKCNHFYQATNLTDKKIDIIFKSVQYKEIKHIQAFNPESLVGNVGGYIGLFIGCAIWDAPDFIEFVYRKIGRWIEKLGVQY